MPYREGDFGKEVWERAIDAVQGGSICPASHFTGAASLSAFGINDRNDGLCRIPREADFLQIYACALGIPLCFYLDCMVCNCYIRCLINKK